MVLKFPGRSWVALGWKPQTQDKSCTFISNYALGTAVDTPVQPVVEPEAEPESKAYPEPESEPAGGAVTNPEPEPEQTPTEEPLVELPQLPVKKQPSIDVVAVGVGNVSESKIDFLIKKIVSTKFQNFQITVACPGPDQVFASCPEIKRICEPSCEWTANSAVVKFLLQSKTHPCKHHFLY